MSIAVVVAHPDDEVIGVGGTIAKYAKEEEVRVIVVSDGEGSTFLYKPDVLRRKRRKESKKAAKILKHEVTFLGFSDRNFLKDFKNKREELKEKLEEIDPERIFTHSLDDPHPHHRRIAKALKDFELDAEIYSFTVSNPFKFFNRHKPRLYVDVSKTHILKRRAIHCFRSQWYLNGIGWYFYPLFFLKDLFNGIRIGKKYAEVFYKL